MRGRMYCIGTTRITPFRITRTGAGIIITAVEAAAGERAGQAAEASTDAILGVCEAYFEQGDAPLAAPVMISNASFAEA